MVPRRRPRRWDRDTSSGTRSNRSSPCPAPCRAARALASFYRWLADRSRSPALLQLGDVQPPGDSKASGGRSMAQPRKSSPGSLTITIRFPTVRVPDNAGPTCKSSQHSSRSSKAFRFHHLRLPSVHRLGYYKSCRSLLHYAVPPRHHARRTLLGRPHAEMQLPRRFFTHGTVHDGCGGGFRALPQDLRRRSRLLRSGPRHG
jgi:hypothetical protein